MFSSPDAPIFLQEVDLLIAVDWDIVCCRVCCNPHIYAWCLLDGCIREGSIDRFMERIGLAPTLSDSPLSEEQAKQRCVCRKYTMH